MHGRFPQVMLSSIVVLAVAVSIQERTRAGEGCCCQHCGRSEGCQKICRLVCEENKITTTCWGYKDEEFCVPGPSKPGCQHCATVCDDNNPKGPCSQSKKFVWTEWMPSHCARVCTKRKLMKRTVTKTAPSYKWLLEDLCRQCEANCEVVEIPKGVSIPPAPIVDSMAKQIPPEPAVSNIDDVKR